MVLINRIEVESDYILYVEFNDGKVKRVDMRPYISKGIFTQLKDEDYFRLAKNYHYFISWPNDQELSSDTLYFSWNWFKSLVEILDFALKSFFLSLSYCHFFTVR